MSRRDTIIIAVLINACLLVILFATSITKKEEPHFATNQELPFSPPTQSIQFEDVERNLVKETSTLEESFPLQAAPSMISQNIVEAPALIPEKNIQREVVNSEPRYIEVTVKNGDYLERIGRENNASVSDIMAFNGLKTTQLRIGQILKIPLQADQDNTAKPPLRQYVVKVGDTPWKIASDHKMQLDELLKLNHLDRESSKHLKPGDTLYIR